jgi:hypothetical protein
MYNQTRVKSTNPNPVGRQIIAVPLETKLYRQLRSVCSDKTALATAMNEGLRMYLDRVNADTTGLRG